MFYLLSLRRHIPPERSEIFTSPEGVHRIPMVRCLKSAAIYGEDIHDGFPPIYAPTKGSEGTRTSFIWESRKV